MGVNVESDGGATQKLGNEGRKKELILWFVCLRFYLFCF